MKKKAITNVKRSILSRLFLQIFILTIIYFGTLWFLDNILNGFIKELLFNKLYFNWFYMIFSNRNTIIFSIYFILIFLLCYRAIARLTEYIGIISYSINTVVGKNELLEFPTDLKDVEITLKNLKYQINYNEQLAKEAEQRKNDLVVYLAHDLKTPLTSIIGYLSLLEETPDIPVEQRAKYTTITLDKAYRLEQLINEFFDITRFNLQSIVLENNQIDITMMLYQIADEFYPIVTEKNLKIDTQISPNLKLIGDADKLARVFDNLLRNAVSYSYEGTVIQVLAKADADFLSITFRNKGDRIPDQKLNQVFEKFFRLDSSRGTKNGGAGLGLAIAKQIIELHRGSIYASSSEQYTDFSIRLPMNVRIS